MRPGRLRYRIEIQQNSPTANDYGELEPSWAKLVTVWAQKMPIRGAEEYEAGAERRLAEQMHRFRIRYRDDLDPTMRIVWDGKIAGIHAIEDPTGHRAQLMITAREIVA